MKILQYLETPQYLRKRLFPISQNLKYVGLIQPINASHHYQINDEVQYREGVTIQRPTKNGEGTWVDVGLPKELLIKESIVPNVRVSIEIDDYQNNQQKNYKGIPIDSEEIFQQTGVFMGYQVTMAESLEEILQQFSKNSLGIAFDLSTQRTYNEQKEMIQEDIHDQAYQELVLFFPNNSIKALHSMEKESKMTLDVIRHRFRYQINPLRGNFGIKKLNLEEQILFYGSKFFNQFNNLNG